MKKKIPLIFHQKYFHSIRLLMMLWIWPSVCQWLELHTLLSTVILYYQRDRWIWELHTTNFYSVASAWCLIDKCTLMMGDSTIRWNIPIKVNVLAWKINLNKFPTKVNLEFLQCFSYWDSGTYFFFRCSFMFVIWTKIVIWWNLVMLAFANCKKIQGL